MKPLSLDIYHYYTTVDGTYRYYFTPFTFHTMRIRSYNEDWSLKDIVIYEALLNRSRRYEHGEFFYQKRRLSQECKVSEYAVSQLIDKVEDLGFLSVRRGSRKVNRKNFYTFNFDVIIKNLEKIYNLQQFGDDKGYFKERFKDFYEYFRENEFYSLSDMPEGHLNNLSNEKQKKRHKFRATKEGMKANNMYD